MSTSTARLPRSFVSTAWFRALLVSMFALVAFGAAACSGLSAYQKDASLAIDGKWHDEGMVLYSFSGSKSGLEVLQILDTDNEEFVVQDAGWRDSSYYFTYLVPSTQYVVTIRIDEVKGDSMAMHWSNVTPTGESFSGDETMTRAN